MNKFNTKCRNYELK